MPYISVNKNVLSASLNKTFPSFLWPLDLVLKKKLVAGYYNLCVYGSVLMAVIFTLFLVCF